MFCSLFVTSTFCDDLNPVANVKVLINVNILEPNLEWPTTDGLKKFGWQDIKGAQEQKEVDKRFFLP